MMKTALATLLLLILLPMSLAMAHPGKTDSNGCHTNRLTGEYHCHQLDTAKAPASDTLTIISVGDGDTIRVKDGEKTVTLRLGCIDAPETRQAPWGMESADRLKQLLPAGQAIEIREINTDRYGRIVAEVFKNNQSVNLQMIQEGEAVIYRQFFSGCSATKDQYLQAEAQAKQKNLGFWNQASPVMPWVFRRQPT